MLGCHELVTELGCCGIIIMVMNRLWGMNKAILPIWWTILLLTRRKVEMKPVDIVDERSVRIAIESGRTPYSVFCCNIMPSWWR